MRQPHPMHLRLLLSGLPIALLAACNTPPQTPVPRLVLPPKMVADAASAPVPGSAGTQTDTMPAPPRFDPAPSATAKPPVTPPGGEQRAARQRGGGGDQVAAVETAHGHVSWGW